MTVLKIEISTVAISISTVVINILSSFMVSLNEHGFIWAANRADRMTTDVIRWTDQVIKNSGKSE